MACVSVFVALYIFNDYLHCALFIHILFSSPHQAYIDLKLAPNTSYEITLDHLGYSNTTVSVNGVIVSLVTLTGGISGIKLEKFSGRLLIGGFENKNDVKVLYLIETSTSRSLIISFKKKCFCCHNGGHFE